MRTDQARLPERLERWALDRLVPYERNARTHSDEQVNKIAASIIEFGFTAPILLDENAGILAGHGRLRAARKLGMPEVPVIVLTNLTEAQRRAYVIADNRLALDAGWDEDLLRSELAALGTGGFDLALTGFSDKELAELVPDPRSVSFTANNTPAEPPAIEPPERAVSALGDLWRLGEHRLLVADAGLDGEIERLMNGRPADLVVTDPPYAIYGSSTGIASDITDDKMVRPFFRDIVSKVVRVLKPFGHAYICCDWRSWASWWEVSKGSGLAMKNMIVWDKGGGLGAMYANGHELMLFGSHRPLRRGMSEKISGERTVAGNNVWRIQRAGRDETGEERLHNAQKPLELFTIPIQQSTDAGELVVDFFGGAGTTLIAAEREHRTCYMMEIEPRYADVIVRRWQVLTSREATLEAGGATFMETAAAR
jgi:DNA modification methylase